MVRKLRRGSLRLSSGCSPDRREAAAVVADVPPDGGFLLGKTSSRELGAYRCAGAQHASGSRFAAVFRLTAFFVEQNHVSGGCAFRRAYARQASGSRCRGGFYLSDCLVSSGSQLRFGHKKRLL